MRNQTARILLCAVAFLFVGNTIGAQSLLDLPRDSQEARVVQRIGLTYVTISYHRPLVKGRQIWGGLVPYGQVWRAGANENTTIEFTDPVSLEGQPLARGRYGLHMIPGEHSWTVILSKNSTSWGSYTYDGMEDALRVTVQPRPAEFEEALTYTFDDPKEDSAVATLRWEKLAVSFQIKVNVRDLVAESLKNQVRAWSRWNYEGWDEAARYLLENGGDLNEALRFEEGSINAEERGENLLAKALILEKLGRKEEAKAVRERAGAVGTLLQNHNFARYLQNAGNQEAALEIFQMNVRLHPNDWIAHNDAARLACARGDFDAAVREIRLAIAGAPEASKRGQQALLKRLEAKEDINK